MASITAAAPTAWDRLEDSVTNFGEGGGLSRLALRPIILASELVEYAGVTSPLLKNASIVSSDIKEGPCAFLEVFHHVREANKGFWTDFEKANTYTGKFLAFYNNIVMDGALASIDEVHEFGHYLERHNIVSLPVNAWPLLGRVSTISLIWIGVHYFVKDAYQWMQSVAVLLTSDTNLQMDDGNVAKFRAEEYQRCYRLTCKVAMDFAYFGIGVLGTAAIFSSTVPFAATIVAVQPAWAMLALKTIATSGGFARVALKVYNGAEERTEDQNERAKEILANRFWSVVP